MRIFTETIREGRTILISVTAIVVALILLVIAMYPGAEEAIKVFTSLENAGLYELFVDATYGEGGEYRMWLAFEVFSYIFFVPVFMMILLGTSVFAAEQDNNRLDILMSMPLSRTRIFFEKWLSMIVYATIFVSIGFLFSWIPSELLDYKMPVDIVFVTWVLMIPLLLFVGTLSAFFGIYFLERFKARLAMVGIVAGMFILTILSRINDVLESLNYLSVFRYFNGADIVLKTSLEEIDLVDPAILLLVTIITLVLILWWVERKDLIPHYDSVENNNGKHEKTGKGRGIPRTFFYISRFRNRLPSFVEQITADRMIINLFLLFAVFVGISGPMFYVGDAEWASLVENLGSNIMYDAMLQGRTVPGTMQGYMITQGYAALWLWFGIFAIIMGPRLVTRDNTGQTTDLLMGNPIKREKLLFERILAMTLQWITIFVVISFSSILGQAGQGDTSAILHSTVLFAEATFLYWAWTMIGVMVAVFLNNKPRLATPVFAGIYLLVLLPYIFSGINPALEPIAQLTPFYWYDPFAIFVEQTLTFQTIAPILVFILTGIVAILIALYRFNRIDVVDTFEDKSLEARQVSKA